MERVPVPRSGLGCLTAVLLVAVPAASAATAKLAPVTASSGPLRATLTVSTHTPTINTKVPLSVVATLNGKPAHASAKYVFLTPIPGLTETEYVNNNKHFMFTGHYSDTLDFPGDSTNEPLTLVVVIKDGSHTVNLHWAITAQK